MSRPILSCPVPSCPVPLPLCPIASGPVASFLTVSCPVLPCPVPSYCVLSCPVRSRHTQSVAEFAFRSNKHTYTTPQLNSSHNILSVSSTNELKIDQERYPNFVNASEATFNKLKKEEEKKMKTAAATALNEEGNMKEK